MNCVGSSWRNVPCTSCQSGEIIRASKHTCYEVTPFKFMHNLRHENLVIWQEGNIMNIEMVPHLDFLISSVRVFKDIISLSHLWNKRDFAERSLRCLFTWTLIFQYSLYCDLKRSETVLVFSCWCTWGLFHVSDSGFCSNCSAKWTAFSSDWSSHSRTLSDVALLLLIDSCDYLHKCTRYLKLSSCGGSSFCT